MEQQLDFSNFTQEDRFETGNNIRNMRKLRGMTLEKLSEVTGIKHSVEMVPEQYKNLTDEEKCRATEFRFGKIIKKAVIYRGEDSGDENVLYLNVEEYLRSLGTAT